MFGFSTFSEFPFVNIANQYTSILNETQTLTDAQTVLAAFVGAQTNTTTLTDAQLGVFLHYVSVSETVTLLDEAIQRGWIKINDNQTVTWNNVNNNQNSVWNPIPAQSASELQWENDSLESVAWSNSNGSFVYWSSVYGPPLIWQQINNYQ